MPRPELIGLTSARVSVATEGLQPLTLDFSFRTALDNINPVSFVSFLRAACRGSMLIKEQLGMGMGGAGRPDHGAPMGMHGRTEVMGSGHIAHCLLQSMVHHLDSGGIAASPLLLTQYLVYHPFPSSQADGISLDRPVLVATA